MNLFKVLDISGSALLAERQRAEVVASNMANAETTHTAEADPTSACTLFSERIRCRRTASR